MCHYAPILTLGLSDTGALSQRYTWSRSEEEVTYVIDVNDINCTRLWGEFEEPCLNYSFPISYSTKDVDIGMTCIAC